MTSVHPLSPTNETALVLGFVLFALIVRIVFVIQWNDTPYGLHPFLDAEAYNAWAKTILNGHFLRDKPFYQSPLYPYLLALPYALFGASTLVAGFFNAVLGAATVGVLTSIALRCYGQTAAIITGLLAMLYRSLVFYSAPIMKEELGLFLLSLFLWFVLEALKRQRLQAFFIAGAMLGLSILVRGNALFLAPLLPTFTYLDKQPKRLTKTILFVTGLVLLIAPATVHNLAAGDFVAVNYSYGFNLAIGHSANADGTNRSPPGFGFNPAREEHQVTWIAENASGRALKPSKVSAWWRDQAVNYAFSHPHEEIVLLGKKYCYCYAPMKLSTITMWGFLPKISLPFLSLHSAV